jgi:hypothetical protein
MFLKKKVLLSKKDKKRLEKISDFWREIYKKEDAWFKLKINK